MCMPEVVDWDGDGDKDLLCRRLRQRRDLLLRERHATPRAIPTLAARGPISADGKTLRVGSAASPCAADFDGDGDLDLITARGNVVIGQGDPVGITYFENVGTRTKPELRERAFPLAVSPTHVGGVAVPSAGDWDADGDLDLVIGDMLRVRLYRNVGGVREPSFELAETLANRWGPVQTGGVRHRAGRLGRRRRSGSDLQRRRPVRAEAQPPTRAIRRDGPAPACCRPAARRFNTCFRLGDPETFPVIVDFNRDGLPDLLQGVASGFVWYYKNVGTRTEPKLAEGVRLRRKDGQSVKIGFYKAGDKATDFATHSRRSLRSEAGRLRRRRRPRSDGLRRLRLRHLLRERRRQRRSRLCRGRSRCSTRATTGR